MNNWEKLCENLISLCKQNVDERTFQEQFELYLKEIFNWNEKNIHIFVSIPVGRENKYADIVLEKNNFGLVVEMKAPNIKLSAKEAKQLSAYMRLLKIKYGILVGEKIQVFFDDDNDNKMKRIAEIEYNPYNKDGIELGNILDNKVTQNEEWLNFSSTRRRDSVIIELGRIPMGGSKKEIDSSQVKKFEEIRSLFLKKNIFEVEEVFDVRMGTYLYIFIEIKNWTRILRYEFQLRNNVIEISLRYENNVSYERSGAKETFEKLVGTDVCEKIKIKNVPNNGKGVCIEVNLQEDSKKIVDLMETFIKKTYTITNEGVRI